MVLAATAITDLAGAGLSRRSSRAFVTRALPLALSLRTVASSAVSALRDLLETHRITALTNREAGTYFDVQYLTTEPSYKELYAEVLPYAAWAEKRGIDKRDTGIDLVAETHTGEVHAVQCKLCAPD